jgi:hypothetical protein
MTTDATAPPLTAQSQPLTLEDMCQVVGTLYLELVQTRRELARLRTLLEARPGE